MLSADFENTIAAIIQNYSGILLASVSGGADSTAMLCALAAIRDNSSFNLRCIHVEHGIRPAAESRGDAAFVQSLCQKLNVPCKVVSIPPGAIAAAAKKRGIGIEAAARLYRRRAWFREARRLEAEAPVRILTAHTADDMLETVLMRILRGSGPAGLAAMHAYRGKLLRPLLTLSRRDVLNYLSANNISYREDATNTDTQFLRNRIRHCLIPQLNEHFPQWRGGVASLAETQSLAAEFIKNETKTRVIWEGVGKRLSADAETFFAQPAIIREEALFQGINRLGISGKMKRANIRRFSEGKAASLDLGRLHIRHTGENIILAAKNSASETGLSLLINAPGSYNLKGRAIEVKECPAGGSEEGSFLALLPLVLRFCLNDDYIERNGRKITPEGGFAAVDALGTAAFIGFNGLLQRRDDSAALQAAQGEKRCMLINLTRGADVQR